MREIKLVISDLDNTLGKFEKPIYPGKQELGPYRDELEKIEKMIYYQEQRGVRHSICTGRSLYSAEPIVKKIKINTPSIFEHGTYIWIPEKNFGYRLVEEDFPDFVEPSNQLEGWIKDLDDNKVFDGLTNDFIRRKEDKHILSYEFHDVQPQYVYSRLETMMPSDVRHYIQEKKLINVLSISEINGLTTGVVHVMPNISKSDGVKHVLNMLKLKKEEVMGIEDSLHSGLPMLKEVGYMACPANAQEQLKEYVRENGGFISKGEYTEGWIQIMLKMEEFEERRQQSIKFIEGGL